MTPAAGGDTPRTAGGAGNPMDEDRRCRATARSGQRCKRYAIPGGRVCVMHGGASPQARAAAERRRADAEATALLQRVWDPDAAPVVNPVESLLKLAGRMEHAVDVLGARLDVQGLEIGGPTAQAWWRVMSELRRALEGLERLGLEEKAVALEQAKAEQVVVAFRVVLEVLALPAEQQRLAVETFVRALRGPDAAVVAGEVGS